MNQTTQLSTGHNLHAIDATSIGAINYRTHSWHITDMLTTPVGATLSAMNDGTKVPSNLSITGRESLPATTLTERDREILIALSLKVRILSLHQIAKTWWPSQPTQMKTARRRLSRLRHAGHLVQDVVNVHPILPMNNCVFSWSPGEAHPDATRLAHQMRTRWTKALVPTTVYVASRRTANRFGGFGGYHKHRTQLTHDLHQGELYVRLLHSDPGLAVRWVGEEVLERSRDEGKLPDAMIMAPDGTTPEMIIEFGGTYDLHRILAFHCFCQLSQLSYQLW